MTPYFEENGIQIFHGDCLDVLPCLADNFVDSVVTDPPYELSNDGKGKPQRARFFYCAKASQEDREEGLEPRRNFHPTVKPTDLMRYLVRLITPPCGICLDPFAGSGSTGKACALEGMKAILIEKEIEYCELAMRRARLRQQLLFT